MKIRYYRPAVAKGTSEFLLDLPDKLEIPYVRGDKPYDLHGLSDWLRAMERTEHLFDYQFESYEVDDEPVLDTNCPIEFT